MHVLICTPAYSGQVHATYAVSLADTLCLLRAHGIQVSTQISAGSSLLSAERNRLIEQFWNSDATHMLCIDADMGWPPQAVLAMLNEKRDFICGVYPSRGNDKTFLFRPAKDSTGNIVQDRHLLGMLYVPAGFLLLSRGCIGKMREAYPELRCEPKDGDSQRRLFALFDTEVYENEYWGEDFTFCRRARDAGIQIWCDPLIEFDHAGVRGALTQCLVQNPQKEAA
jgi:hypothetical protein